VRITVRATRLIASVLIAAAAVFATILAAAADTSAAEPIHLDNVEIVPWTEGLGAGGISVTFTNANTVAARRILFDLIAGGKIIGRYDDAGSFAPGTRIKHGFVDWHAEPGQTLAIERVTFSDGSSWAHGEMVPAPEATAK
jgi:hypothetical protein